MKLFAKKSLGQNFLSNPKILSDIVDAGRVNTDDIILEIGPGTGNLTQKLLEKAGEVIAIEKDNRLIQELQKKFAKEIRDGRFELINADILELDIKKIGLKDKNFKIIANIPYYITGQFLKKFLQTKIQPSLMVLMVQKEVAKRVVARDEKESILSISIKAYGEPKYIRTVEAGNFYPKPNVDSAVLLIDNISKEKLAGINEEKFFEIVKAGFAQKRKRVLKNLEKVLGEKVKEIGPQIGIDPNTRAEDLTLEKWLKILTIF